MRDEGIYAERALRSGADGYITKEEGAEKVLQAIEAIRNGGFYLSESIAARAPSLVPRTDPHRQARAP